MFGWSMFLGLCGVIAFLAAGALFFRHFSAPKKGQTKGEEKKSIPYLLTLSIASGISGFILFGASYYFFYWHYAGRITTPPWLDQKMIYRVGGQAEIEEQNAVFLGNAKKDVWCANSDPLDPKVRFVRVVKTPPPENKWVLESVDIP